MLALIGLAAYWPAPFTGPADPLDPSYVPKPEWNFLFLYQALKAFPGSWERVGTLGIPTLIFLLLVLLPFLDRRPERSPAKRPLVMIAGFIFVGGVLALTYYGYNSTLDLAQPTPSGGATISTAPGTAPTTASSSANLASPLLDTSQPSATQPSGDIATGKSLFTSLGCSACHSITGTAGVLGPDLSQEVPKGRTQSWLAAQLHDPKAHNPNSIMPPYRTLADNQKDAVVSFLLSLSAGTGPQSGKAPTTQPQKEPAVDTALALPASGEQGSPGAAAIMVGSAGTMAMFFFNQYCLYCHSDPERPALAQPGSSAAGIVPRLWPIRVPLYNSDPLIFAQNIDRFIQHGSRPAGAEPHVFMPAFGATKTLSQPQIANIEAYILSANGADRGQIMEPGVAPERFFQEVAAVLALLAVGLGVGWFWSRIQDTGTGRRG